MTRKMKTFRLCGLRWPTMQISPIKKEHSGMGTYHALYGLCYIGMVHLETSGYYEVFCMVQFVLATWGQGPFQKFVSYLLLLRGSTLNAPAALCCFYT